MLSLLQEEISRYQRVHWKGQTLRILPEFPLCNKQMITNGPGNESKLELPLQLDCAFEETFSTSAYPQYDLPFRFPALNFLHPKVFW